MSDQQQLEVTNSQYSFVSQLLFFFEEQGLISNETAESLLSAIEGGGLNWNLITKCAFTVASIFSVISFFAMLGTEKVINFLTNLETTGATFFLGFIAVLFFLVGYFVNSEQTCNRYVSGTLYFLGVCLTQVAIGISVAYQIISAPDMQVPDMLWMITSYQILTIAILAVAGLLLQSSLVWVFAILSLGSLLGSNSLYAMLTEEAVFSLPEVYILYGCVLLIAAFGISLVKYIQPVSKSTQVMGLLYIFISLWVLSSASSLLHLDGGLLHTSSSSQLMWVIILFVAACCSILHGLYFNNTITRGFGLTFLTIIIVQKFFELFWFDTPKSIFFGFLALGFWAIGVYAEDFYNDLKESIKGDNLESI
ncbi:MAG: hypothetical protein VX112_05960 [Pseudomonadota bacterium]|nr:hypothetical protein [Pseudomonadota bacterium]